MTQSDLFPISQQCIYLNHAAIAPWPAATADAVAAFAAENAHHGPAGYNRWLNIETRVRELLAQLVNAASADDIALLKNTSEGLSLVAQGIDWRDGDNLVIADCEFPSNRLPWLALRQRGVEVRQAAITGSDTPEALMLDACDRNTRLISVSAVQWGNGQRMDVDRLGAACRQRGMLFCVDGIQQLGALPFDALACQADFIAADAHKWMLGPEGIAVFYTSSRARDRLQLRQHGWRMLDDPYRFEREDNQPSGTARRFEPGSPNMLGIVALQASLTLMTDHGIARIGRRNLALCTQLIDYLDSRPGVTLNTPVSPERRAGIVNFSSERVPVQRIHRQLAEAGVVSAMRNGGIRLSPHYYITDEQIRQAITALDTIL